MVEARGSSPVKISGSGCRLSVDERQFLFLDIGPENHRIYYRVTADGVEFPSLVCIFASQKSTNAGEELKTWGKNNATRLESGAILHADLWVVKMTAFAWLKNGRLVARRSSFYPAVPARESIFSGSKVASVRSGNATEIFVPPLFDSTFIWPLKCRTRSRIPVIPTPARWV